jgi:hypothetical protein
VCPWNGHTLLGIAVFSKSMVTEDIFLELTESKLDAGFQDCSQVSIFQHACIAGVSNKVLLAMIASSHCSLELIRMYRGKVTKCRNGVSI